MLAAVLAPLAEIEGQLRQVPEDLPVEPSTAVLGRDAQIFATHAVCADGQPAPEGGCDVRAHPLSRWKQLEATNLRLCEVVRRGAERTSELCLRTAEYLGEAYASSPRSVLVCPPAPHTAELDVPVLTPFFHLHFAALFATVAALFLVRECKLLRRRGNADDDDDDAVSVESPPAAGSRVRFALE